jgi:hypothetical protein
MPVADLTDDRVAGAISNDRNQAHALSVTDGHQKLGVIDAHIERHQVPGVNHAATTPAAPGDQSRAPQEHRCRQQPYQQVPSRRTTPRTVASRKAKHPGNRVSSERSRQPNNASAVG